MFCVPLSAWIVCTNKNINYKTFCVEWLFSMCSYWPVWEMCFFTTVFQRDKKLYGKELCTPIIVGYAIVTTKQINVTHLISQFSVCLKDDQLLFKFLSCLLESRYCVLPVLLINALFYRLLPFLLTSHLLCYSGKVPGPSCLWNVTSTSYCWTYCAALPPSSSWASSRPPSTTDWRRPYKYSLLYFDHLHCTKLRWPTW